ncbi:unnamed protein product [Rotaria socialis]|uniref:Uncharacterized protein n=1 Tax=Rotaria socialis TaxID=392032 RepID=A0A820NUS8_9BILA|nr:unnamed protein product [Rotaria socialis]
MINQIGEIYPCYVHKKLLDDATKDRAKINLKYTFQWTKSSKTILIIWLPIGSASIVIGIVSVLIAGFFVLQTTINSIYGTLTHI